MQTFTSGLAYSASSTLTWELIANTTSGGTSTGNFALAGDPSTWLDSGSASLASARPTASFSVAN